MDDIRAFLSRKPLLFDGGMGTYYKAAPGTDCEQANLTDPAGVRKVHAEYLAAGADAIKTNTFGLPGWRRVMSPAGRSWRMRAGSWPQRRRRRPARRSLRTSARPRIPRRSRRRRCILLWPNVLRRWGPKTFCSRP